MDIAINNDGLIAYQLLDYDDVSWDRYIDPFKITQMKPSSTKEEDKKIFQSMLNKINGIESIKDQLEK